MSRNLAWADTNELNHEPVRVLSVGYEKLVIWQGVFFLLMSIVSVYFVGEEPGRAYLGLVPMIAVSVLLLNVTHSAFTFTLPMSSFELRTWWSDDRIFGLSFRWIAILFFSLTTFAVAAAIVLFGVESKAYKYLSFAFESWTLHHVVSQIHGFSRLYDHRYRSIHGERGPETNRSIRWQRGLMIALTIVLIGKLGLVYSAQIRSSIEPWLSGLTIAAFLLSAGIPLLAVSEDGALRSNKWIFLLRLLPLSLIGYDFSWPYYAYVGMHGVENVALLSSMKTNSTPVTGRSSVKALASFSIILIITSIFFLRPGSFGNAWLSDYPAWSPLFPYVVGLSLAAAMTHYLIEGRMFRMKSEPSRRLLGPLLNPPGERH